MKNYLMTPGPTPVPPEVSRDESLPVIHHRTKEFGALFNEVVDGMKYVLQTKNDIIITINISADTKYFVIPFSIIKSLQIINTVYFIMRKKNK